MPLKPSKFQLDESIHLAGRVFHVAGIAQLEMPDASVATRYLLSGDDGTAQILEKRGGRYAVLKQFAPSAAPEPNGKEITVMDVRYPLRGVDRLSVLGSAGVPVGAAPPSGLMLSGRFEGEATLILREFAPGGTAAQSFYTVKQLGDGELLDAREHAAAERARLEQMSRQAAAHAETGEHAGGWGMRIGAGVVAVLVAVVLAFACTADKPLASGGAQQSGQE